jgi:hypothetical protein
VESKAGKRVLKRLEQEGINEASVIYKEVVTLV